MDPWQVLPVAPAHEPSTLTSKPVTLGMIAEVVVLLHVPNPGWQPVPQYAAVLPQKPAGEQQSYFIHSLLAPGYFILHNDLLRMLILGRYTQLCLHK